MINQEGVTKTKKKEAVQAVEEAKEEKKDTGYVQKFSVKKLMEHCMDIFGVSQSTFAGAMYGHEGTKYTIDEAKLILDEWLYGKKEGSK